MRRAALASFVLASSVLAQAITVGPPGSGAAFDDIQPAIDAAQPGDTLLVAAGTYGPFVLDKPLKILGAGSNQTFVAVPPGVKNTAAICVQDLGAGEDVVIAGMGVQGSKSDPPWSLLNGRPPVLVTFCEGQVVFQDLHADNHSVPEENVLAAVEVWSAARVMLLSCTIGGDPVPGSAGGVYNSALRVVESELWVVDSLLRGGDDHTITVYGIPSNTGGFPGLDAYDSAVYVARSEIHGGEGAPSAWPKPSTMGAPAVSTTGSTLGLVGGPGSHLRGGDGEICQAGSGLALYKGSQAVLAEDVVVEAGKTYKPYLCNIMDVHADTSSSWLATTYRYPTLALSETGAPPGGFFTIDLAGNPGTSLHQFTSLDTGPGYPFYGLDGIFALDFASLLYLGTATLDGAGAGSTLLAVPSNPVLIGATLYFQSLAAGGPAFAFSNPSLLTVR